MAIIAGSEGACSKCATICNHGGLWRHLRLQGQGGYRNVLVGVNYKF